MKSNISTRDNRIDYLKGLAMIMVVLLHSIQMIDGLSEVIRKPILLGQIGVQAFFFCSGYLAIKSCVGNRKQFGFRNSIAFLKKKYVSLFVPFVIFMVIYLTINLIFGMSKIELPYKNNTDIIAVLLNATLIHGLIPSCINNVVPGGWYIGTLLILLGITPLIIRWIRNAKHAMLVAVTTAVISLIVSVLLHHFLAIDTSNGSFFYFSFFNQAPAYLVGMSMALGNQIGNGSIGFRIIRAGTLVLVILALFYFEFSFSYAVIPLLAALMFADVYTFLSSLPTLIRKTKWLCRIGQNTFAIFLSHFLVAWYIPIIIEKYLHITGMVLWMIVLCLCAVLCVLSPYISLPMTKLTKWFEKTLTKR